MTDCSICKEPILLDEDVGRTDAGVCHIDCYEHLIAMDGEISDCEASNDL